VWKWLRTPNTEQKLHDRHFDIEYNKAEIDAAKLESVYSQLNDLVRPYCVVLGCAKEEILAVMVIPSQYECSTRASSSQVPRCNS